MSIEPFPFATLEELRNRWPDRPDHEDTYLTTQLEDASQFILDVVPEAANATPSTRRRIVCAVIRRALKVDQFAGLEQIQASTGPFAQSFKPTNPNGDYYLTAQEKKALGAGRQQAFSVGLHNTEPTPHKQWCGRRFNGGPCDCGADNLN